MTGKRWTQNRTWQLLRVFGEKRGACHLGMLCLGQGVGVGVENWGSGSAPMTPDGCRCHPRPLLLPVWDPPHLGLLGRLSPPTPTNPHSVLLSPCRRPPPQPTALPAAIPCMHSGRAGDVGSCLRIDGPGNAFSISPRMLRSKHLTASLGGGG